MPTAINTGNNIFYSHPIATISVADALREADFVEVPYLWLQSLRITAGPEIDQALLGYDYGTVLQHDETSATEYPPLVLAGKFVKIVITDTITAGDPPEPEHSITWYGVVEPEERYADGATPAPANVPKGTQVITAFGLLRLLEKQYVTFSKIDIDGTDDNLTECQSGLPFNTDPGGMFAALGNRSANKIDITQEEVLDEESNVVVPELTLSSHVFSWEPRGASKWSAYDAVEYLLTHHTPRREDGKVVNQWKIDGSDTILSWYDIAMPTDQWNVKALIDGLIPRSRAVGYRVEFDPEDDSIHLVLFTFTDADITFPDGDILPANDDQYTLDFEHAIDVEEAVVLNTAAAQFHRVVAVGAKRTTTFTARLSERGDWLSSTIIGPTWTEAHEQEYKDGASGASDYSGLGDAEKRKRNAVARSSDRLREVWSRFVINPAKVEGERWDGLIPAVHDAGSAGERWWLRGDIATDPFDAQQDLESDHDGREHTPSLRVMRAVPLYEGVGYSGTALADFDYSTALPDNRQPSFIPVVAYARTFEGDGEAASITTGQEPHRYELLDKLGQGVAGDGDAATRLWSVDVGVGDTSPSIELRASVPHFISGATDFASWAVSDISHDPEANGGIDYRDIWITMCVELSERVESSVLLFAPADNAPLHVLTISVPDARHDYVLPHTVVEIKDGLPVQTTSGGFARNDKLRLDKIVHSAIYWYGKQRQALRLKYKQIRDLFRIGWLITDVGSTYNVTNVNSPITAITYHMGIGDQPGHTQVETSFVNLDFTT